MSHDCDSGERGFAALQGRECAKLAEELLDKSSSTCKQELSPVVGQGERRPRVAHLVHCDGDGGGPVSISRTLKYFHATQDQFVLAGGRGRIHALAQQLGIPFYQLPLETKGRALTVGFWKLLHRLRVLKPDVLVVHGQWGGPLGALAGRLTGVPRIIYVARWPSFYTSWDLLRVIRNHLAERIPCRLSDWTVTLSESNRYQYFLRRHVKDDERLLMIPNAISVEDRPTPDQVAHFRQQQGWSDDCCHVVSVGRLTDQKRVMWLIKSWPEVVNRCPQARLWIIGEGPRRPFLEGLAKTLKITGSCRFLGEQPGIMSVAAADIVAMTSVYESRGNVAMEAMLCGKPVVASDVDGIRDTIRHDIDGFLVQAGNVSEFSTRLIRLIETPTLRRVVGEAGQKSIMRYDTPLVMSEYEKLFARALGWACACRLCDVGMFLESPLMC